MIDLRTVFRRSQLIVAAIVATFLLGCSTLQPGTEATQATTVPVAFKSPNRLRFSGKGSGAGMMLMSSMGATGIAIGVAIDEGIGKEIAEALTVNNFAFSEKFEAAVNNLEEKHKNNIQSILVERYGFKTKSYDGFEDAIVPDIQVKVLLDNGSAIEINYPQDFSEGLVYVELEETKSNGELTAKALSSAVADVLSKLNEINQPQPLTQ